MSRKIKIINGLQEFRVTNAENLEMEMIDGTFILSSYQTKIWELCLFLLFPIAFWIWWIISEEDSIYTLMLLLGLTLFWIFQFYKIAKAENILEFNLITELITISNINIILSHFRKPKYFSFNEENKVIKKKKSIGKHSNNFRLYFQKDDKFTELLDVKGNYESDKILFGLNQLVK